MTDMPILDNHINWDELGRLGRLRAVIDPHDVRGLKNILIDRVHWLALRNELRQSKTVLDFGCGTGRFSRRIAKMGIEYFGIDPSADMIKSAQEWNPKGRFQIFDDLKIPLADGNIDTVIVGCVFVHLLKKPKSERILKEIFRVLKPGGHLILLEEASLSGKKSGQTQVTLTEKDFTSALSKDFEIQSLRKVRSSEFSKFSRWLTEGGPMPYFMFRLILTPLSWFEAVRAARLTNVYYTRVTYYDFLIHARKP